MLGTLFVFALIFSIIASVTLTLRGGSRDQEVSEKLDKIIAGQQLATILKLEPASLKIRSEDFAPRKEVIRAKLLEALRNERWASWLPDTRSTTILEAGGIVRFVVYDTYAKIKSGLIRLLVNDDIDAAERFLGVVVDQLSSDGSSEGGAVVDKLPGDGEKGNTSVRNIFVTKTDDYFQACLEGSSRWESGKFPSEALGKLLVSLQGELGFRVIEDRGGRRKGS